MHLRQSDPLVRLQRLLSRRVGCKGAYFVRGKSTVPPTESGM